MCTREMTGFSVLPSEQGEQNRIDFGLDSHCGNSFDVFFFCYLLILWCSLLTQGLAGIQAIDVPGVENVSMLMTILVPLIKSADLLFA